MLECIIKKFKSIKWKKKNRKKKKLLNNIKKKRMMFNKLLINCITKT